MKKEKELKKTLSKVTHESLTEKPDETVDNKVKNSVVKSLDKKTSLTKLKTKEAKDTLQVKEKSKVSNKALSNKHEQDVVTETEKIAKQVVKKIKNEVGSLLTTKNDKSVKLNKTAPAKKGKQERSKEEEPESVIESIDLLEESFSETISSEIKKNILPDLSNINYSHLKKLDRPEPMKIQGEPTILVKTEVKRADPEKARIKKEIFDKCMEIQSNSVAIARKAMNEAQESANEEKGSMEEKFDSFRESMHIVRDLYARQYQEGVNSLGILKRINPNMEHNTVILGSVVYTDLQNYFVSVSLGEVISNNEKFITISAMTPLFQALSGKTKGDKFKFRDKTYTILEVF